ncbi:thioredoxin fold domain-containing protein [Vibrio splendidus]|nr:thioredoxin fold domain-containing protein [Vibrio splendidus]MCC4883140.1 thioredoxin fold domain-containing protein [Vibrio splendidus]
MSTEESNPTKTRLPLNKAVAISIALATGCVFAIGFAATSTIFSDNSSMVRTSNWLSDSESYRPATQDEMKMLSKQVSKHMGTNIKLLSAARTSIPQLYYLLLPNDAFYYHAEQNRFIRGDIYNALNKANETESLNKILGGIADLNGHSTGGSPASVDTMNANQKLDAALGNTLKQMKSNKSAEVEKARLNIPSTTGNAKAATTPTISKSDLDSQMKHYGEDKMSNEMQKFNLDGRVDPSKVQTYRTTVKYMGSSFPRVGYSKDGKELAPEVQEKQIKALVSFVERAGDRWSVVYKAKNEKASMVVFTDPTCPFCKKFHSEIEKYNEAGITVYYLFYPRHIGMGMEDKNFKHAMKLMDSIWYNKDRNQAADDVFDGYRVSGEEVIEDIKNPAFEHYLLGQIVGTEGTPRILMSNGDEMTGYLDWTHISKKALK